MEKRFWREWYTKRCTFYFGFFSKKDYRVGLTVGNLEGSIDLIVCTAGYLIDHPSPKKK